MDEKEKYECEQLIGELSKMPSMVIATAYLHAINYTLYGEDVTEKWLTATQNASALEKAYKKGYYDALQRRSESSVLEDIKAEIKEWYFKADKQALVNPCVVDAMIDLFIRTIDKYKGERKNNGENQI